MLDWRFAFLALSIQVCHFAGAFPSADNPSVYWRQTLVTNGKASFNTDTSFQVFRNVKSYGAKGDGSTDDTAAIQAALNAGTGRTFTESTTTTPAVVYLPAGTYIITSSLTIPYYTQIVGSAISGSSSTIKAAASWSGGWMLDADPYQSSGNLGVGSTNDFYKEIRHVTLDLSASQQGGAAIHWPVAQATLLQDITINMSPTSGSNQVGIFTESGSGGFLGDIVFNGGNVGLNVGNQQFESLGLTFNGCQTAINQIWDWTWTYKGLSINNCGIGINMNGGGTSSPSVGSVTVLDSTFVNTPTGISTVGSSSISPATAGSLLIDNTQFTNSPQAVVGPNGNVLLDTGSSTLVASWALGHTYSGQSTSQNYQFVQGSLTPPTKDARLLSGGAFISTPRPSYAAYSSAKFISVKTAGAHGDGGTDDTSILQSIFNQHCASSIVFFDAGAYIVTNTINVPAGCWIVGEGESVIMATGSNFASASNPTVVLKVGNLGDSSTTQISGMMFSNQGGIPGAIMIEWNVLDSSGNSGIWTSHFRMGGARGTNQVGNCLNNYSPSLVQACSGAFLKLHIKGSGYFENMWLWTADHVLDDDPNATQINIYTGRGLLIESTGASLFNAVASEHCALYMYQINTQYPVYMGLLQSETPYYQPVPAAPAPFTSVTAYNDPIFSSTEQSALGLRILNSPSVLIYGAGHYSFFSNYTQNCITGLSCQKEIVSIENSTPFIYNIYTIGSLYVINVNGSPVVPAFVNQNVYPWGIVAYSPSGLTYTPSTTSTSTSSTTTTSKTSTSTSTTTSTSTSTSTSTTSTTKLTSSTSSTTSTHASTTTSITPTPTSTSKSPATTSSSTSAAGRIPLTPIPATTTTTSAAGRVAITPVTTTTTKPSSSSSITPTTTASNGGRVPITPR